MPPPEGQGEVPDDQESPYGRRGVDINVLQYQVGAMQSALDRGIGGLERAIDKGFEGVGVRLDRFEARLKTIEERQAFDAARLKALEQFREEQDRREAERAKQQETDLRLAVDGSDQAKLVRTLVSIGVGLLGVIATIIGIIVAFNGGFG